MEPQRNAAVTTVILVDGALVGLAAMESRSKHRGDLQTEVRQQPFTLPQWSRGARIAETRQEIYPLQSISVAAMEPRR
jgi:hypothetical protein